ncbi:MAG: hypothetical protein COB53_13215 [Elusimicrobia bacterium]|nr:MAG: hypothetical protein COB53_13215 [Elusimicrobiota bacterium]
MNRFLLRLTGPDASTLAARLMKTAARTRLPAAAWQLEEGFVFSCGAAEAGEVEYRSLTASMHQGGNTWKLPRDRFSSMIDAAAGAMLNIAGHTPIGKGIGGDFEAGYEYARANWPTLGRAPQASADPLIAIDGETAIAMALIASGCGYFAASAGAPASKARALLHSKSPRGRVRIVEAGDAVAAAFSAAGAGYGGIRAAAEVPHERELLGAPGASWAASAEVPFVLLVSEPGSPESFGGIVRAPASIREVYRHIVEAFDLAESYQTSATIIIEPALRSRWETIVEPTAPPTLHRGRWVVPSNGAPFDRYALTEDGISPRSAPGMAGLEHSTNAIEGDDSPRRKARFEKLSRKDGSLREAIGPGPVLGPDKETVLVARGAVAAALRGPVEAGEIPCGLLPVRTLRPFAAKEIAGRLFGKRIFVAAERSDDALLRLLRSDAGLDVTWWRVSSTDSSTGMIESLSQVISGG